MIKLLMLVVSVFPYTPTKELSRNVQYWQRLLGLQSWRVSVQTVSAAELESSTLGDIDIRLHLKTARIRLLREEDYDLKRWRARSDQLLTLAHEMVHLKRRAMGCNGAWNDERATNEETLRLLHRFHRRRELMAIEKP